MEYISFVYWNNTHGTAFIANIENSDLYKGMQSVCIVAFK